MLKNKKLFSATMAAAMALSLSVPAFAAVTPSFSGSTVASTATSASASATANSSTGLYGGSLNFVASTNAPVIKVTIPAAGDVVVNPYKMSYTVDSSTNTTAKDQIISATNYLKSESNVALTVGATVTGGINSGSDVVFSSTALKGTETTKSVYMYMESTNATTTDGATWTIGKWATAYDRAKHVLVSTTATTNKSFATIPAATFDSGTCQTPSGIAFRLTGSAADKSAKPWTENDVVGINIAFTFTPVAPTK